MKEMGRIPETEIALYNKVVSEYLKYGSVDELLKANNYDIPISYAGIHRILDKWGIVKAAGPNRPFSEMISFFVKLAEKKVPLETLYAKMPPSFGPAAITLHRAYRNLKENFKKSLEKRDLRRVGAALIISPEGSKENILVGYDVAPRVELGKPFGAVSLPMGFSKRTERASESIKRILQQEVFMEKTVNKKFPEKVIPEGAKPFMYVDVADVRVSVFSITLPGSLSPVENFSSHKLKRFKFLHVTEVKEFAKEHTLRAGLTEIVDGYKDFLLKKENYKVVFKKSWINSQIDEYLMRAAYEIA